VSIAVGISRRNGWKKRKKDMTMTIGKIIPLKDEDESNAVQQKLLDAGYQTVGGGTDIIPGALMALCIENDHEDGPWFAGIIPGSSLEFYETITVEDAIGSID
jgi:hypothetical protein